MVPWALKNDSLQSKRKSIPLRNYWEVYHRRAGALSLWRGRKRNTLKDGGHIVAELIPTSDKFRRWIAVNQPQRHPLDDNASLHVYSVLDFELDKSLINEYFGDEDMVNQRRYYAETEDELIKLLISIGIDLSAFTYP
jgi:hypothetical protein